jgi:hypothetical protein
MPRLRVCGRGALLPKAPALWKSPPWQIFQYQRFRLCNRENWGAMDTALNYPRRLPRSEAFARRELRCPKSCAERRLAKQVFIVRLEIDGQAGSVAYGPVAQRQSGDPWFNSGRDHQKTLHLTSGAPDAEREGGQNHRQAVRRIRASLGREFPGLAAAVPFVVYRGQRKKGSAEAAK